MSFGVLTQSLGCERKAATAGRVVLYCAQDREYAEELLAEFSATTGIPVAVQGDTEANKSVSLVTALLREQAQPRADVFWNNEPLGTIRLAAAGVLADYTSPAAASFPSWTRAENWQAFAARARIILVHRRVPDSQRPKRVADLAEPTWRGRAAMAKPLFGTTATHMVCLYTTWGPDQAGSLFRRLAEHVTILPGNRDVAEAVAAGRFDAGLTDTDDAITLIRKGAPVDILYPDQEEGGLGTLFLPNMLALIRSGPNPEGGKKLIDFLLRPETERRLAEGPSAQLPLNPQVQARLEIASPNQVKAWTPDFAAAAARWDQAQSLLREIFAR